MFSSLRWKLIGAFALVIFLCLFLAGSAFLFMLRNYETEVALNRFANLAHPISLQVGALDRAGASPSQISTVLRDQAQETKVRVLLVDKKGQVLEDTHGGLTGQHIQLPTQDVLTRRSATFWRSRLLPEQEGLFFLASAAQNLPAFSERFISRSPSYLVVLAIPQRDITATWLELAPSLAISGLIAMIISTLVALLLSRSISKPIAEITRASEEMARGNFDQVISLHRRDEIGRLALAFNAMTREVNRSHRMLRDFLANVSHELRTPLTSIQGFSQAMVDGAIKTPEEYAESGRIVHEEANRMRTLVEDILYLSKIESGQIEMDKQPLDLSEILHTCAERCQQRLKEAQVNLAWNLPPSLPIGGDSHRLEQVFGNLLDNAIKHTPPGGTITLSAEIRDGEPRKNEGSASRFLEQRAASPKYITLSVHNTGSVIPEEDLPRIFDRFYQGEKSRSGDSFGLGLAIAKEVVQAHGGTIEARSEVSKGTEFAVNLPLETI